MNSYLHYKDYIGSVVFSEDDEVFHGKVIGIKDLLSFEGDSVSALIEDFHDAIDEYLEYCNENGKKPEKPFKGSFNVRIQPDLHRAAALAASASGKTLNAFVEDAIRLNIINTEQQ
ncbi:type II toxin-antitoxin system HicB family antitoxin [Acetanaerobacterium elongatum]|uniref:Predicted nuclease of the RNAse H fold, HicB family n=1 Tax=Acetanaerobacterium elongatum TaxID=258515 RepID=A0A1H0EYZ1_9FIRM|nr:type II toxin-antitoxin system HicB family antitoxin [Acetanaerobacterium elongatum]SDN87561.1 Predicted nuclease of the RNAse H fold, HicB family [Acetanaerobacterium elongatum]